MTETGWIDNKVENGLLEYAPFPDMGLITMTGREKALLSIAIISVLGVILVSIVSIVAMAS